MNEIVLPQQIREVLGGSADYAFDCTGIKPVIQQAIDITRPEWGVVVLVGIPNDPELILSARSFLSGRTLTGSYFGKTKGRSGIRQLADWLVEGKLHCDKLVSHRFKLEQINDGFDVMKAGKSIRSVIVY